MAKINSRQELADYCLRQLGAPVINIEVDDSHIEDAIENALSYYHEIHYDGIIRDYVIHTVTGTQITVADASGFRLQDTLGSIDGTSTKGLITKIVGNTLTLNKQIGLTKFQVNQQVMSYNTNYTTTITNIVIGDEDNGYLTVDEGVVGVNKILNITSVLGSSDYMFNMQYQIMMTELQALTKAGASTYWQTMNYLGHLDFIMKKEKNFEFNRRMNRLILEVSWGTDINVGDIVVAEVYRMVDPEAFTQVYNDRWLKKYATALMKKQWGGNLSKYTNMQLPGGLTFNGRQLVEDANAEIEALEEEALNSSAPLNFLVG
jgi:hypothetical protein